MVVDQPLQLPGRWRALPGLRPDLDEVIDPAGADHYLVGSLARPIADKPEEQKERRPKDQEVKQRLTQQPS